VSGNALGDSVHDRSGEHLPMSDLRELYQSVILDHNSAPRNYGPLADATGHAEGRNPLCGDEVTVWVRMDGERLADVHFVGTGCAISKASASLMTTAVKGKTTAEVTTLADQFRAVVTGQVPPPPPSDATMGRLAALSGVSRFPIRVKCATLAWHALHAAIAAAPHTGDSDGGAPASGFSP
jgi:nitrogen fixation NifU-like protein